MSQSSAIEWTDATWNPVTGCSKISPGCAHCYAEAYTERMAGQPGWIEQHEPWTPANAGHNVRLHRDRLQQPLRWRQPRMIFVNSMSDLFHEQVPTTFIVDVFNVMREAHHHTFQVLTKRPERMANLLRSWPLQEHWPNVWLGTSIENRRFVERADWLRLVPAAVRFISAEPLLGPLVHDAWPDFLKPTVWSDGYTGPELDLTGIHWLIVGGESGPVHRPIREEWVRRLRHDCELMHVAFFFKQWGGRTPRAGGRLLDGRTWDEMPTVREAVSA